MTLTEIYRPKQMPMRVAGFMSGSGSNLVKIIEHARALEARDGRAPYRVVAIFSDNPSSKAMEIGRNFGIPSLVRDIKAFYRERKANIKDVSARAIFDMEIVDLLKPFRIDVAAYAGYTHVVTKPLIEAFLGVNVHPADLSIMDNGKRKYTGVQAVRDAILAGEKQLRATTHIVEPELDSGRILMISASLAVNLPDGFDLSNKDEVETIAYQHQNRLKEIGDWVIFPRTLEYIAQGKYARDAQGDIYFEGRPIPQGVRL